MSVLGFVKDVDPIVEYDDGQDCNLFDLSEPKSGSALSLNRRGPYLRPMHTLAPAEKGMNASLL